MRVDDGKLTKCTNCLRYVILIFCIFAWIFGFTTFVVGIYARVNGSLGKLENYIPSVHQGANLLIVVGLVIMVVGFVGCFGAIRENKCMLMTFFLLVFFSFSLLMAAGLWSIASRSRLKISLQRELLKLKDALQNDPKSEEAKAMNWIQRRFKCCGANSPKDYTKIPATCEGENQPGCYIKITEFVNSNLATIAGLGIGFGVLSIIGMVSSFMMCCIIKESEVRSRAY